MQSLPELQRHFLAAVLDGADAVHTGSTPPHLLSIYSNNARVNFANSLRASFPVIQRLVGEDYFSQLARGFHRAHPSQSGDLQPSGVPFAAYLHERCPDHPYLAEVARLEWAAQEALLAAEHAALEMAKLALVAPDEYGDLCFRLHPSARLFESCYPCLKIYLANLDETRQPPLIDLQSGGDALLLQRTGGELTFAPLSPSEYAFVLALHAGRRIGEAIQMSAGEFDAGATLQRLVRAHAVVDFYR